MAAPIMVFHGCDGIGNTTKNTQALKNRTGIAVFTLIGRGASGCRYLRIIMPAILAATENHNI